MAGELFERMDREDEQRLLKAGWTRLHGTDWWQHPDGSRYLFDEAVKKLERDTIEKGGGQ